MTVSTDLKIRMIISNIRKIRESKNYSQYYLAIKLGISQNAYSKIELEYTNITLRRLLKIAEVLEVDIIELINSDIDEPVKLRVID